MNSIIRCARHYWFCAADPLRMGGTFARRERFNEAVFIDPERRFLFTKNEKCGNNTARRTLQFLAAKHPLPEDFADTRRWQAPLLQPSDLSLTGIEDINGAISFKFAIVRNPYVRTLSVYLNKFHGHGRQAQKFARALGKRLPEDFGEFVSMIAHQRPEQMDPHWRVQYDNIFCGIIRYDHFIRFENFESEFHSVLKNFYGAAEIRPVRKRITPTEEKLSGYYRPELVLLVRDIYRRDFEFFGYSADLPV
ncbi:MAG: sulfotransferase family 2 domain-containing protein [Alphaproteobacteria bacterium]